MEMSRADRVKNEVLQRVKEEWNFLHGRKRKKANWISRNLRGNCLLKYVTEGKIDETGRRHKQLLDNFKEKRR